MTIALKPDTDGWNRPAQSNIYKTNASYIWSPDNVANVLALLDSTPSDRVLDIGCGSGELTARLVGAEVIGTDASPVMIDQARAASSNGGKIQYYVVDGLDLTGGLRRVGVDGLFDKVFSNAALHWMKKDPSLVVKGVRQVLKPGGIFAAEYGGYLNLVGVRSAVHAALRRRGIDPIAVDPFYFPTAKQYSAVLSQSGFHVNDIELVPRVIPLPNGLRSWLQTFGNAYVEALPSGSDGEALWDEVEDECRVDNYTEGEGWSIMYMRLRFRATAV